MKVLLCCTAGVTSNMFAAAIKDEAKSRGIEVTVWAAAEITVEYSIERADVVLVTPQLAGSVKKLKDLSNPGTPILLISQKDFETFNAKGVLDEAIAKLEAK